MVQKLKEVASLEEILNIREKGDRLYKLKVLSEPFKDEDIYLKVVLNAKKVFYSYGGELSFYGYKKDKNLYFDSDGHPYWNAYFDDSKFRLYDGIFLGRYGCGGGRIYRETIQKLYDQLANNKKLIKKFKKFCEDNRNNRLNEAKKEFGLLTGEVKKDYIYDENDDIIIIFGRWYRRIIDKDNAYEKKIKNVTPKEHKEAFKKYTNKIIKKIEEKGFKLYAKELKGGKRKWVR